MPWFAIYWYPWWNTLSRTIWSQLYEVTEFATRKRQTQSAIQNCYELASAIACARWPSVLCLVCVHAQSLQSCPTLCRPVDSSLPGSSVLWILQAVILEWVAMPFSRRWRNSGLRLSTKSKTRRDSTWNQDFCI